jgi:hypothetical protein
MDRVVYRANQVGRFLAQLAPWGNAEPFQNEIDDYERRNIDVMLQQQRWKVVAARGERDKALHARRQGGLSGIFGAGSDPSIAQLNLDLREEAAELERLAAIRRKLNAERPSPPPAADPEEYVARPSTKAPAKARRSSGAAKKPEATLEQLRAAQHDEGLPLAIDFEKPLVDLDEMLAGMVDLSQIARDMPDISHVVPIEMQRRFEYFKDDLAGLAEDVLRVGAGLEDWTLGDLVDRFKELVIQLLVIEPLVQRIRDAMSGWRLGGGSGGGGLLGLFSSGASLFGAAGGGGGASGLGGGVGGVKARAAGGPVAANDVYMVGERGPELFVPRTPGTIVPNHALGGGNLSVTVNVNAKDAVLTQTVSGWVQQGVATAIAETEARQAKAHRRRLGVR